MSAPFKREGMISRFNGIDVEKTHSFVKIHCSTYIKKITKDKPLPTHITTNKPTLMPSDSDVIKMLDTTTGPSSDFDKQQLEKDMGFKYCAATGELLFAMVTCQPDISNAVIKLTQFNSNPAKCHYEAVLHVFKYLAVASDKGLHFLCKFPNVNLPKVSFPTVEKEEYHFNTTSSHHECDKPYIMVD